MGMSQFARLVIAAALAAGGLDSGQAFAADEPTGDQIVVEAPRRLPVPVDRSPYSGAPIAVTTIKMSVLFGDLDLSREADAESLLYRIDRVAQDACRYLDRLYPLNPDPDCMGAAVAKAKATAKAEIAAAAR